MYNWILQNIEMIFMSHFYFQNSLFHFFHLNYLCRAVLHSFYLLFYLYLYFFMKIEKFIIKDVVGNK